MTETPNPRPAAWAVGLLVFSSAFALVVLFLVSTGYIPF